MTAKKTTSVSNGHNKHNGHVSLAREEYDAFVAREESYVELITKNAKTTNQLHDVAQLCDSQAKRMVESDLKITHLERVNATQATFIDMLRADAPMVASLGDLSEFWRQWTIHTHKAIEARKATNEEVAKFEPDLFRTWRNWVNDAGKTDRVLGMAGSQMTRGEYEATMPHNAREWQEHTIRRLREDNAKLSQQMRKLEDEIDKHKNAATAKAQDTQPQEKRP